MIDKLKQDIIKAMQTQSHEIKYHKQFIESSIRHYREKTKGDVWAEMINWYDLLKDLEFVTAEIRKALWRYHDLHDFLVVIRQKEHNVETKQ